MFDPSPVHLLVLGVIVLLVMGPKRLPELARSLGHGIREFRGSLGGGLPEPQAPPPGGAHQDQGAAIGPTRAGDALPFGGRGRPSAAERETAGTQRPAA
ncbi:MAG: hypothetical protein QOK40_9 [Miltoncostaeaceae bacterium]|jgi:sec-independent protein translocase protein TatA|nr:hypothetical protein [Miltoncostaeaceae bacterium]